MKFKDMPYERIDFEKAREELTGLIKALKEAKSGEEQFEIHKKYYALTDLGQKELAEFFRHYRELAQAVSREIEEQLKTLEREEIARASIEANGKIIVARSLTQAAAVANRIAPEHLELSVDNPFDYLGKIENAGSIFLGRYNPEPMGDYFAGPNHTLPTMGTARFYSPLSVDDFIKKSQFSYYTREALEWDYRKVSRFAKEEGLTAHARAVDIRFEKEGEA